MPPGINITIDDLITALGDMKALDKDEMAMEIDNVQTLFEAIRAQHPDLSFTFESGPGGIPVILKKCNPLPLSGGS